MAVGDILRFGYVLIEQARIKMEALRDPIVFKAHESHIIDLAFTSDSRYLLSAGMDNLVHQWLVDDWSLKEA